MPTGPAGVKVEVRVGGGRPQGRTGSSLRGFGYSRIVLRGPAETAKDPQEGGILRRHWWQVLADPAPLPPVPRVVEAGKFVFEELGSHESGTLAGKGVSPQEAQRPGVGEEELVHEVDQPGLTPVVGHGGEPDLPVHPQVVG